MPCQSVGGFIFRLRQRQQICGSLVVVFAAAVSVATSGCWMAAAQFAPLAANAAEYVGGTALELTSGIGANATAKSRAEKQDAAEREAAMNSGDACNQLEIEVPDVIELRRK